MWLSIYLAMFGFAVLATLIWAVVEARVPMMTLAAAFAWAWLAFRGAELTQYTNSGSAITTEAPVLQVFCGFMAFSSMVALVLYRFGDFPPDRQTTAAGDPDNGQ